MIEETGRLTDTQIELDEGGKALVDEKLRLIAENLASRPLVTITWFRPDDRKAGGAYVNTTGHILKIDLYERYLLFDGGQKIPISRIHHLSMED